MGRNSRIRTIRRELREAVASGRVDINWANDAMREVKGRSVTRQGLCVKPAKGRAYFTKEKQ